MIKILNALPESTGALDEILLKVSIPIQDKKLIPYLQRYSSSYMNNMCRKVNIINHNSLMKNQIPKTNEKSNEPVFFIKKQSINESLEKYNIPTKKNEIIKTQKKNSNLGSLDSSIYKRKQTIRKDKIIQKPESKPIHLKNYNDPNNPTEIETEDICKY